MILLHKKENIERNLDIFASFGGVMGDLARQQVTKFVNECAECVRAATPKRRSYFCRAFSGPMNFS